jgi:hypothetical protein
VHNEENSSGSSECKKKEKLQNKLDNNRSCGKHKIKKEAFDKWLSSKQDIHKQIYKEKNAAKSVIKAKNEMWDKTYSKINSELGFKRSGEARTLLKKSETTNKL